MCNNNISYQLSFLCDHRNVSYFRRRLHKKDGRKLSLSRNDEPADSLRNISNNQHRECFKSYIHKRLFGN